jgi:hypothetical protein
MDEALLKQQAEVYKVAGVDESEENKPAAKKRKRADAKPHVKERAARENTAIYVTQLPDGVTEAALADFFGRCGLIAESVDSNKPRIKLYYNDDGSFKGDALIGTSMEAARMGKGLADLASLLPTGICQTGGGSIRRLRVPHDTRQQQHAHAHPSGRRKLQETQR